MIEVSDRERPLLLNSLELVGRLARIAGVETYHMKVVTAPDIEDVNHSWILYCEKDNPEIVYLCNPARPVRDQTNDGIYIHDQGKRIALAQPRSMSDWHRILRVK